MTPENSETLDEEPTIIEIADSCRDILDSETCDEIAAQESTEDALGLAFTALIEAGEDPEEFLKNKNLLE